MRLGNKWIRLFCSFYEISLSDAYTFRSEGAAMTRWDVCWCADVMGFVVLN